MRTNQEYKNEALAALKGKWAPSVVATIVLFVMVFAVVVPVAVIEALANPDAGSMSMGTLLAIYGFTLLIYYPLSMVGYCNAFKVLHQTGDDKVTSNMFSFTFEGYLKNLGFTLLYILFVFLWALLFYIPGIVKGIAYSLSPFILKDNPELSANEAINLSQKMMKGHKFDLFFLMLSFIGWIILGAFTLGIAYMCLVPYMSATLAAFYQDVKKEYIK